MVIKKTLFHEPPAACSCSLSEVRIWPTVLLRVGGTESETKIFFYLSLPAEHQLGRKRKKCEETHDFISLYRDAPNHLGK